MLFFAGSASLIRDQDIQDGAPSSSTPAVCHTGGNRELQRKGLGGEGHQRAAYIAAGGPADTCNSCSDIETIPKNPYPGGYNGKPFLKMTISNVPPIPGNGIGINCILVSISV